VLLTDEAFKEQGVRFICVNITKLREKERKNERERERKEG
jgi:hypothetical protein